MKNLLIEARAAIMNLRHQNEILSARCDVLDLFAGVLLGKPMPGQYATPDIAYELKMKIQELDKEHEEKLKFEAAMRASSDPEKAK